MGVNIRPARRRDAAAVVAMSRELSAGEGKPERGFDEARFRRDGFGRKAAFGCLIAEVDGETAGYALWHQAYDAESGQRGAFMHDLYLKAPYRGQGLGKALIAEVCRRTQKAGGDFVWWCMVEGNGTAEAFYHGLAKPLRDLRIWIAEGGNFERLADGES